MKNKFFIWIVIVVLIIPFSFAEECAEISEGYTYDANNKEYSDTDIIIPKDCVVEFERFTDCDISLTTPKARLIDISGSGSIEGVDSTTYALAETRILSLHGSIYFGNGEEYTSYYVDTIYDLSTDDIPWSSTKNYLQSGEDYILANSDRSLTIGNEDDSGQILIDDETEIVFSKYGIECLQCIYQIEGEPTMHIIGPQFYNDVTNLDFVSETYVEINGEQHVISGDIVLEEGTLYVPPNSQAMVDGVYISADQPVNVYFEEDKSNYDSNFVKLGDTELKIHGEEFSVALGTGTGGRASENFQYEMTTRSDYMPADSETGRLLFDMDGGNVVLNKNTQDITVFSEGVDITNGVNKVSYYVAADGGIDYAYQYVGCETDLVQEQMDHLGRGTGVFLPVQGTTSLCSEVPYRLIDGGSIRVQDYVAPADTEISIVGFDRTYTDRSSGRTTIFQEEYNLDTGEVYVVGYKGGEAAKAVASAGFFGADEYAEKKQWGHVGLLYHRDGEWWIAESDGRNTKIIPIENSLFGRDNKMDGLFRVETAYPNQVIQEIEEIVGTSYSHPGVTTAILDREGIYCSSLVTRAIESADDIDDSTASFSELFMSEESSGVRALVGNLVSSSILETPGEIINSPYLSAVPSIN